MTASRREVVARRDARVVPSLSQRHHLGATLTPLHPAHQLRRLRERQEMLDALTTADAGGGKLAGTHTMLNVLTCGGLLTHSVFTALPSVF